MRIQPTFLKSSAKFELMFQKLALTYILKNIIFISNLSKIFFDWLTHYLLFYVFPVINKFEKK